MLEILNRAKARLGSGSKASRLEKLDARKNSARSTPTKQRADKVENEDENSCILETKKVTWSSMQLLQKKEGRYAVAALGDEWENKACSSRQ